MTTIIRPYTLLRSTGLHGSRPLISTLQASSSRRSLHLTAPRYDPAATPPNHASTALQPAVRDREEHSDSDSAVVGGSGKGVEGAHFQGKSMLLPLCSRSVFEQPDNRSRQFSADQIPSAIQIKDSQAGWTMFKPIYTEAVSSKSFRCLVGQEPMASIGAAVPSSADMQPGDQRSRSRRAYSRHLL